MNLLNDLGVLGFMAQMVADAHRQTLFLGDFVGGQHFVHAGCIHGHRFLHEHVFPGVYCRPKLIGAEPGWRAQEHHVHLAGDRLLIRIQPHELAFVGHIDAVLMLGLEERTVAPFQRFAERIGQRHELDIGVRAERVIGGTGATPAAPHQGNANDIAPGGVGRAVDGQPRDECHRRRCFEKLAARGPGGVH